MVGHVKYVWGMDKSLDYLYYYVCHPTMCSVYQSQKWRRNTGRKWRRIHERHPKPIRRTKGLLNQSALPLIGLLSWVVGVIKSTVVSRRWYKSGWWPCLGHHRHVSYHTACREEDALLANKHNGPRAASSPATTRTMDKMFIGLHGIHAGRAVKIMQANPRYSYINTLFSA